VRLWRKPLDQDRIVVPRGEIHVIVERCKGCELCVTYCPRDALVMSSVFNAKGYHPPQVIGAQLCVACGLCEMLCPEFAIFVLEESRER
jgi:2-oxoglutarate ferredoxin oxidoreductase subunit delta